MSARSASPLVMTLLVRDEADIVAQNLAFHFDQGVDHVIAMDNGSTDGTRAELETFAETGRLTLLHEPSDAYLQDAWMTRMALMARDDLGADWVICNDADEFWRSPTGCLKDVLPPPDAPQTMLACARHQMVAPRDLLGHIPWPEALICRPVSPPPLPLPPETLLGIEELALDRPYFCYGLPGKMIFPTRGLQWIHRGAHGGTYDGAVPPAASCPVEIFHFPIRSRTEFQRSVRRIGTAIAGAPGVTNRTSWKYRRWHAMTQAAQSGWPAFCDALPDRRQVRRDLKNGTLVEDRRILDALARLSPPVPLSTETEMPHADPAERRRGSLPPDGVGDLILVTGPDDRTNARGAEFLKHLGAPAGRNDATSSAPGDPVRAAHRALMHEMDREEADLREPPEGWFASPSARSFHTTLMELLLVDHVDLDFAVLHDTRLCALLALWVDMAAIHGLGLHVVLAFDEPLSAAETLRAQTGLPMETAALLWTRRILSAESNSRNLRRFLLPSDDLIGDWRETADRFHRAIAPGWPRARRGSDEAIEASIGPSTDRSRKSDWAATASPRLPDVAKEVHELMCALSVGDDAPHLTGRLDEINAELRQHAGHLQRGLDTVAALRRPMQADLERALRRAELASLKGTADEEARRAGERRAAESDAARRMAEADLSRLRALLRVRARLDEVLRLRRRPVRDWVSRRSARMIDLVRNAVEFDAEWYLAAYPDAARGPLDPAAHFVRQGAFECRNPGPHFDTLAYYSAYADVVEAGQIALIHYLRHGRHEGRVASPAQPLPL